MSSTPISSCGAGLEDYEPGASEGSAGKYPKVSLSDIQGVQNLIERCLQNYMSREEVITTLERRSNIPRTFTSLVLQQLEQQNPEFFWVYYLRLKLKDQIVLFNYLLDQQNQMVENLQRLMQGASPGLFPRPAGMMLPNMSHMFAQHMQMQCNPAQQQMHTSMAYSSSPPAVVKREESGIQLPSLQENHMQGMQDETALSKPQIIKHLVPASSGRQNVPASGAACATQETDLSLPMDLGFPGAIFGTCPSPEKTLPGASTDLISTSGLQDLGSGSNHDYQVLVDNISYNCLDSHVRSLSHDERGVFAGSWTMELPKIGSFSDMAALDFESLHD